MKRRMKSREVPVVNPPFSSGLSHPGCPPGGVSAGLPGDICATVAALAWRANPGPVHGRLAHAHQHRPAHTVHLFRRQAEAGGVVLRYR